MDRQPVPLDNETIKSLEEQIATLYSRNLFLRQEEIDQLQESARAIDLQAGRNFLLLAEAGTQGGLLGRETLIRLIENLRKLQAQRPSDASRLKNLREQALTFRKSQVKKGRLARWFARIRGEDHRAQAVKMHQEELRLDLELAEIRHQTALYLLQLMLVDAHGSVQNDENPDGLNDFMVALRYRENLRRRKHLYVRILTNLRTDLRVVKLKGGL